MTDATVTGTYVTTDAEVQSYKTPIKRKGRLKKGEKVVATGYKPMTIEEAFASVEGMKHKIAQKYRVFCNQTVLYEDLISAANVGLAWAYRDWDANTAKFTTFSHKRIERSIDLSLCEMFPKYKNNVDAKNWLRRKNDESFKTLQEKKITKDEIFNKLHGLNGIIEFTKEHYNLYTQKVANNIFNDGHELVITPVSGFSSSEANFDILNVIPDKIEEIDSIEHYDIDSLSGKPLEIARKIMEGYSITEIAREMGVTKSALFELVDIKGLTK